MRWILLLLGLLSLLPGTDSVAAGQDAFLRLPENLAQDRALVVEQGRRVFNRDWVPFPGYRNDVDGLGPAFNRTSCGGCHPRNGRGRPPERPTDPFVSMILRLTVPSGNTVAVHPVYGTQINDRSVVGVPHEGEPHVRYEKTSGRYPDGTGYDLLRPEYGVEGLRFGPLGAETVFSPRVAPPVAGLGRVAEIPDEVLQALADPYDSDGDGISGRLRLVDGRTGRFGWKAGQPDLLAQTASALINDIGITSRLHPSQNCPDVQTACQAEEQGGQLEIDDADLDALVAYQQAVLPPRPRAAAPRGRILFTQVGCAACHRPEMPVRGGETIRPYSDFLLHDMGVGLSDAPGRAGPFAAEWRTPPLWGIGSLRAVNGHRRLLHDGRARGVAEAILWHGGEGAAARDSFMALSGEDRAALIDFVNTR